MLALDPSPAPIAAELQIARVRPSLPAILPDDGSCAASTDGTFENLLTLAHWLYSISLPMCPQTIGVCPGRGYRKPRAFITVSPSVVKVYIRSLHGDSLRSNLPAGNSTQTGNDSSTTTSVFHRLNGHAWITSNWHSRTPSPRTVFVNGVEPPDVWESLFFLMLY